MTSTIAIATLMLRSLLGPMFQMFPFPGPGMSHATASSISYVAGSAAAHSDPGNSLYTSTVTLGVAPTAGCIVIGGTGGYADTSVAPTSITLNGNTASATIATDATNSAVGLNSFYLVVDAGGAAGTKVITATWASPHSYLSTAAELACGNLATSPYDKGAVTYGTSAIADSGNISSTIAGDLLVGIISTGSTSTQTAGTTGGFTYTKRASANYIAIEDVVAPVSGTYSANTTFSFQSWSASVMGIKPTP